MKNALLLLSLLLAFTSCTQEKTQNQERIRVSGEGKIRVKPNMLIITLQVAFTQPRMADAVRQTQQTVDSVVSILGQFGNLGKDLKTSSVSANKEYSYNTGRSVFVGYQASQSIDFVLNDITKFTELTAKLLQTKISSISQLQFGHTQADSLFREADLLAYDDAFKSANKLTKRANVTLGRMLYLSNTSDPSSSGSGATSVMRQEMNAEAKGFGGSGFKISPEVLEFKRMVVSEYEIKP
ncbi:SIMPL domain-containing protein [Rufibacter sp. LB8]|uniref:SIMPL domain-containing protein n=1 Tax=Rufibacter sp. LB8 TaxID=2777781 RepID=UPI00178C40B6|nr:SIMPL domain-containing protein [Rufibacter sp. LB8]